MVKDFMVLVFLLDLILVLLRISLVCPAAATLLQQAAAYKSMQPQRRSIGLPRVNLYQIVL
jgi:multisubunit Na+/H+ antiporter MnhG subunit